MQDRRAVPRLTTVSSSRSKWSTPRRWPRRIRGCVSGRQYSRSRCARPCVVWSRPPAAPSAAATPARRIRRCSRRRSPRSRTTGPTSSPTSTASRYQPIPESRIIAARPGVKMPAVPGPPHGVSPTSRGNAFYCLESNFVAYDDVALMPRPRQDFGPFSVALVLAHEWGHAVQDRAGNDERADRVHGAPGRLLRRRVPGPRRRRTATRSR